MYGRHINVKFLLFIFTHNVKHVWFNINWRDLIDFSNLICGCQYLLSSVHDLERAVFESTWRSNYDISAIFVNFNTLGRWFWFKELNLPYFAMFNSVTSVGYEWFVDRSNVESKLIYIRLIYDVILIVIFVQCVNIFQPYPCHQVPLLNLMIGKCNKLFHVNVLYRFILANNTWS